MDRNEMVDWIRKHLNDAFDKAEARWKVKFKRPKIAVRAARGRLGSYSPATNTVMISSYWFDRTYRSRIKHTCYHEAAHAICHRLHPGARAHGPEWKAIMGFFDIPRTRCTHVPLRSGKSHAKPRVNGKKPRVSSKKPGISHKKPRKVNSKVNSNSGAKVNLPGVVKRLVRQLARMLGVKR